MPDPQTVAFAALIPWLVGLLAAFGWGDHWNAYVNLTLSLSDLVLWATLFRAVRGA